MFVEDITGKDIVSSFQSIGVAGSVPLLAFEHEKRSCRKLIVIGHGGLGLLRSGKLLG